MSFFFLVAAAVAGVGGSGWGGEYGAIQLYRMDRDHIEGTQRQQVIAPLLESQMASLPIGAQSQQSPRNKWNLHEFT